MRFRLTTASFVTAAPEQGTSQLWCSPVHSASSRQNERKWCLLIKTQLFSPRNTLPRDVCDDTRVSAVTVRYIESCALNISQSALHPLLFTAVIHSYYLPFVRYSPLNASTDCQPRVLPKDVLLWHSAEPCSAAPSESSPLGRSCRLHRILQGTCCQAFRPSCTDTSELSNVMQMTAAPFSCSQF